MKRTIFLCCMLLFMLNVDFCFSEDLSDSVAENFLRIKDYFPETSAQFINKAKEHIHIEDGKVIISDAEMNLLINEVDSIFDRKSKVLLEIGGVTKEDVKTTMESFKDWDEEKRAEFVECIETNDKAKISEIVEKEKFVEVLKTNNFYNKKIDSGRRHSSSSRVKAKDKMMQIELNQINNLAKENKQLRINHNGVRFNFASQSLLTLEVIEALKYNNTMLEIGVTELTIGEKEKILKSFSLGERTDLFEVGGKVFDLTAQVIKTNDDATKTVNKIKTFNEPVAVTIDLSDITLPEEEIANLTGVRYDIDDNGNMHLVKLGGTYDLDAKTFTCYTNQFGYYGVLKKDKLTTISLTINEFISKVNNEEKINDVAPVIINNRTMVPVRFIAENLGAEVKWDEETKTVTIDMDGKTLSMVINAPIENFDTSPTIVNNRTFVPIRYVSEKLGANVLWFKSSKTVSIVK